MRLIEAMRLDRSVRAALVGAGGKTAVLFQTGREFLQPPAVGDPRSVLSERSAPVTVCLTATTHLGVDQVSLADWHLILEGNNLDRFLPELNNPGAILVTGTYDKAERFGGLSMQLIDHLRSIIDRQTPLIIEADGSRQRPLKAPASHEPAIPEWVDLVVVTAGLSGLGKPLTNEWVHRPELFGALAQLEQNSPIQAYHLEKVLTDHQGGLKNIPDNARRILILNQAQTEARRLAAKELSVKLLDYYEAVVVTNLPPAVRGAVFPAPLAVAAAHERVAGVILAAGASRRFGRPKQTLEWQGKPFVRLAAETALRGGLRPVVVVVGSEAAAVQDALRELPVKIVFNEAWETGQASSIKAGLKALPPGIGAAIFLPVDKPRLPVSLLHSLVDLHAGELVPIAAPMVNGQRSNPVLFDRTMFERLSTLTGDVGGRALFDQFPPTWLRWDNPTDLMDIDTPEDYNMLLGSHPGGAD